VLSALGTKPPSNGNGSAPGGKLEADEMLPNEFEDVHEEEI
jgi:hypothetical protein